MKNEPPRIEIFRGHFEECWMHFAKEFNEQMTKGAKGSDRIRQPIADFCGVETHTIKRWLDCKFQKLGGQEFKLMCFLDVSGYRVIELEQMTPSRRNFTELVGFSIVSTEEAITALNYTNPAHFYRVLRSAQAPNQEREAKMWEIWKEKKDVLEAKKEAALKMHGPKAAPRIRKEAAIAAPTVRPPTPSLPAPVAASATVSPPRFRAVVHAAEGLLMMLEDSALDNITDSELVCLRKAGGNTVLRLLSHLSVFTSKLYPVDLSRGDG